MADWVIDEAGGPPGRDALVEEARRGKVRRGGSPRLVVRMLEVVVHDNRRLFGEARVRLDALVVHGGGGNSLTQYYAPGTFRFDRVADGDRLPIGAPGLLLFLGRPRHFLDLFIVVSRDRAEAEPLEVLLGRLTESQAALNAYGTLLAMATGVPDPQLLSAALTAALSLGDAALAAVRRTVSGTIGLYRSSWLRGQDGWGIGRHPPEGLLRAKDVSFGFEILKERA